jgi:hypothetical protein
LDAKKTLLESKVKDLEAKTQEIELGKIVVSPEPEPITPPAPVKKTAKAPVKTVKASAVKKPAAKTATLEGQVLVVNKEYSFAVINLGNKSGVQVNQVFSVYHNNRFIGDMKVEKVHDSMAAAGFLTSGLKFKINEGDKVVQKL